MKPQSFFRFLIGLLLLFGRLTPSSAVALESFSVRVDYLDNSKFPQVEAYVSVSDANGLPVKGLTQDSFALLEDDKPIAIQSFEAIQNKEQSLSIALLIDSSGSMKESMGKAIAAAVAFVNQLSPQDRIAVIHFNDAPFEAAALTENKQEVVKRIESLQAGGRQTALYDAIVKGIETLESQSGRKILVMVTDGQNKGGKYAYDEVMKRLNDASIPIYPIGIGGRISVAELQKMAEITGGGAKIIPTEAELSQSFNEILSSLREQYRIRYISSLPANNTNHNLTVTVNYGGGQKAAVFPFLAKSSAIPVSLPDMQAGQTVGGMVKFAPVIDWPPALISKVEVFADGAQLTVFPSADKASYEWNSFNAGIPFGERKFLVKVTDLGGNTGQAEVSLNLQPPIRVEIVSPQNGSSFAGATQIIANVLALPGVTVSKVSFFVDNQEYASLPGDPALTEYKVDWRAGEARQYPVRVEVYDSTGLFTTQTETIHVNVEPGGFGAVILVVVLAFAALVIPLALRSRKRRAARSVVFASGSPSGKAALREIDGLNPGKTWELSAAELKLGRKREENDVPLKGLSASRRHAVIRFEQGQYVLYCLNPENPVMVNETPVSQKQALARGDVIRLGETTLQFDA